MLVLNIIFILICFFILYNNNEMIKIFKEVFKNIYVLLGNKIIIKKIGEF